MRNVIDNAKLYHAAVNADDAWHAELVRLFGKQACNIRYTKQGEGNAGTELNRLYLAWVHANNEWMKAYVL